jgi:hypothetical protein
MFLLSIITLVKGYSETFTVPPLSFSTRGIGLHSGDAVVGSIDVIGGSGNDINFYVTDPNGNTVLNYYRTSHSSFSFSASITGTYFLRFDNSFSLISSKSVSLDYTVKASIFGIPQDTFYIIVIILAIAVVTIVVVAVALTKRKPKLTTTGKTQVPKPPSFSL